MKDFEYPLWIQPFNSQISPLRVGYGNLPRALVKKLPLPYLLVTGCWKEAHQDGTGGWICGAGFFFVSMFKLYS